MLDAVEINIRRVQRNVTLLVDVYSPQRMSYITKQWRQTYDGLTRNLDRLTENLKTELGRLKVRLSQSQVLTGRNPSRTRRALLPFVGSILKGLFGVADQKSLAQIKSKLRELALTTRNVAHVVEDSLTLLNVTRVEVTQLRLELHTIRSTVVRLQQQQNALLAHQVFMTTYTQIANIVTEIRSHIVESRVVIDELAARLSDLFQGHLTPQVIPPDQLRQLLQEIETVLPPILSLPFDPENELFNYYQYLGCYVYPGDGDFTVLIDVPLADVTSQFNVFQILTYDVPYGNTSIVASYEIAHEYVAVSPDRSRISFLEDWQLHQCSSEVFHFCRMTTAIYFTNTLQDDCTVSLLLHPNNVHKNCKPVVRKRTSPLSKAVYISNGLWKISTPHPLVFTIVCTEKATVQIQVNPPLGDLKLHAGCYAHSGDLNLPPFFFNETFAPPSFVNIHLPMTSEIWAPVGEELSESLQSIPAHLDQILDSQPTISELKRRLSEQLRKLDVQTKPETHGHSFMFYAIIVLIGVTGFVCMCVCVIVNKKRLSSLGLVQKCMIRFRHEQSATSTQRTWAGADDTDPQQVEPMEVDDKDGQQEPSLAQVAAAPYLRLSQLLNKSA